MLNPWLVVGGYMLVLAGLIVIGIYTAKAAESLNNIELRAMARAAREAQKTARCWRGEAKTLSTVVMTTAAIPSSLPMTQEIEVHPTQKQQFVGRDVRRRRPVIMTLEGEFYAISEDELNILMAARHVHTKV